MILKSSVAVITVSILRMISVNKLCHRWCAWCSLQARASLGSSTGAAQKVGFIGLDVIQKLTSSSIVNTSETMQSSSTCSHC
jgi:hypothetical protein